MAKSLAALAEGQLVGRRLSSEGAFHIGLGNLEPDPVRRVSVHLCVSQQNHHLLYFAPPRGDKVVQVRGASRVRQSSGPRMLIG